MIELQENTVVADRFRLVRLIGKGGMGSVWEAVHIGLDTPCALKFIEGNLINVAEAHTRFEREAKVSAQLRSPHIVQIIDNGVWEGRPYIAMELLEGEDLSKKIADSGGRLSPEVLNQVIQQLCRALTKAHGAGIVHRDLKPDNIFLVNDDDRQLVKILDFGVAKSNVQAIEGSNTKTGTMLGTPYYMSPEQAQGVKTVDARSDLWSVAVIAYQCLTGRLPFESEALGDLLVKIIVQPIPVPSEVAPVPEGFDRWWARATDRDRDRRFQTAKELAQELELALGLAPAGSDPLATTALVPSSGRLPAAPSTVAMDAPTTAPANPATFSGVEPPITIPKKGAPIGVIAVVGVLVLVGLGGAGLAMNRGAASGTPTPTATTPTATTPTATQTIRVAPPPKPIEPAPAVSQAVTEPEPAPSASIAPKPLPKVPVAQAPAPVAAPVIKPQPSASAKKWDPGF